MKAPLEWLEQYVALPDSLDDLVHRLIMSGTEVEEIIRLGERWDDVVVGHVQTVDVPEGSRHLSVVRIDIGERAITAVTGAPNIAPGQHVPVVLLGGTIPVGPDGAPFILQPRKMLGITGEAMVLSERELGMSEEHSGILVLPETAPIGGRLIDIMGGVVLDVEAKGRSDELAIFGVAREIAAVTAGELTEPDISRPSSVREQSSLSATVRVEASDLCPRFSAIRIDGIRIAPSPQWLARRLEAAGVRSINNVVDVTNYVMLELGQPLHAYDFDKIPEATLIVRRAKPGEMIVTLDGVSRTLDESMLLVADVNGPSGIAGIMGAGHSEVVDETTSVLLEAANWDRVNLRRSARKLGMRTEASGRFERGVPPELTMIAVERCVNLFAQVMSEQITVHQTVDVVGSIPELPAIDVDLNQVERLLGTSLSTDESVAALKRLGFEISSSGSSLSATPPYWRRDVEGVADIAEEIARMIGYDDIPESLPGQETQPVPLPPDLRWELSLRRGLWGLGISEAWTDTLTSLESLRRLLGEGAAEPNWSSVIANPEGIARHGAKTSLIALANAPSSERSHLRNTLIPSLLDVAANNLKHTRERVAFFEMARTFFPRPTDLPYERRTLGLVLAGDRAPRTWNLPSEPFDFFDLKGAVEEVLNLFSGPQTNNARFVPLQSKVALHPGRSAEIHFAGTIVGYMGELHPLIAERFGIEAPVRALAAEIDLDALIEHASVEPVTAKAISRFPSVKRDIALTFPRSVDARAIQRAVTEAGGNLLQHARLVDVYEGESVGADHRSIALALEFQSESETLTQESVSAVQDGIVLELSKRFGGVLRA